MRPSRSSALLLACTAAFAAPQARAQSSGTTGTPEGAAFLLIPVGARATSLGQAAVADGGSTETIFWNPAGLADLKKTEIALHHYAAFFGNGDAFVVAVPAAVGTFGAAAYIVDYGDFAVTQPGGGVIVGNAITRNIALELSYATTIAGGFSAGIAYKLVQFRVDCSGDCSQVPDAVGTTHALDLGIRYALPGNVPLVFGASIRNLGFKLQVNNQAQADPLPTRVQVGVAWLVVRHPVDAEGFDVRVLADVQGAVGESDLQPATLIGVDTGVSDALRVRAGYAFVDSQQRGPALGLGVKVGRLGLDVAKTFYAADAIGERDPFHVSLRLDF
jgi:hypothetical protein